MPPEPAPTVVDRLVHGGEHDRVLAHAEIVVRAPHGDRRGAASGVKCSAVGEGAAAALQIGEDAIAAFGPDNVQRVLKFLIIVHDRP